MADSDGTGPKRARLTTTVKGGGRICDLCGQFLVYEGRNGWYSHQRVCRARQASSSRGGGSLAETPSDRLRSGAHAAAAGIRNSTSSPPSGRASAASPGAVADEEDDDMPDESGVTSSPVADGGTPAFLHEAQQVGEATEADTDPWAEDGDAPEAESSASEPQSSDSDEDSRDYMLDPSRSAFGGSILDELTRSLHRPYGPPANGCSPPTVLQEAYYKLRWKQLTYQTDKGLDGDLARQAAVTSQPNLYPRSLYLVKRLLGVQSAVSFEHHVCVSDCSLFPRTASVDPDERCPICQEPRYYRTRAGALKPRKRFWYFGLENTLRQLFADRTWCRLRQAGLAPAAHNSLDYKGSAEYRRLRAQTGDFLSSPDNGVVELGFDFGQVFAFKNYSCGLLGIRSADIPAEHRSKLRFCKVIAIIPGPREPRSMNPYLEPLLDDLDRHGPRQGGVGMQISNLRHEPDGSVTTEPISHKVVLGGIYADTPAQRKLSKWFSYTGVLGCGYCDIRSVPGPLGSGRYFVGYKEKTVHGVLDGESRLDFAGCPENLFTHEEQLGRGMAVETGVREAAKVGAHGLSLILKRLPYTDANNIWVLPVCHASLFGVVKDFWNALLAPTVRGVTTPAYALPGRTRKLMSARAEAITTTLDFSRPYQDVVTKRGSYVMEDWLHFTETFSVCVLLPGPDGQPVLPAPFSSMWAHLRDAVVHWFRASRSVATCTLGRVDAAQRSIRDYARLLQEHVGITACKYNLHLLAERALQQEKARGLCCFSTELWVETSIVQRAKRITKYRTTHCPEVLLANSLLTDAALISNLRRFPHELEVEERRCATRGSPAEDRLTHPDSVSEDTGVMLGSGQRALVRDGQLVQKLLHTLFTDIEGLSELWGGLDAEFTAFWYKRFALKTTSEVVHTADYTAAKSRLSHFIQCRYFEVRAGRDTEVVYAAKVVKALKLTQSMSGFVLRLAVCELYETSEISVPGRALRVLASSDPTHRQYPVLLDSVDHKLLFCNLTRIAGEWSSDLWLFVPYSHVQSYNDPDASDFAL